MPEPRPAPREGCICCKHPDVSSGNSLPSCAVEQSAPAPIRQRRIGPVIGIERIAVI